MLLRPAPSLSAARCRASCGRARELLPTAPRGRRRQARRAASLALAAVDAAPHGQLLLSHAVAALPLVDLVGQDSAAAVVAAAGALVVIKACDFLAQEGWVERVRPAHVLAAVCDGMHGSSLLTTALSLRRSPASWCTSSAAPASCSAGCCSGEPGRARRSCSLLSHPVNVVAPRPRRAWWPPPCRWLTVCAWRPLARACCATRPR